MTPRNHSIKFSNAVKHRIVAHVWRAARRRPSLQSSRRQQPLSNVRPPPSSLIDHSSPRRPRVPGASPSPHPPSSITLPSGPPRPQRPKLKSLVCISETNRRVGGLCNHYVCYEKSIEAGVQSHSAAAGMGADTGAARGAGCWCFHPRRWGGATRRQTRRPDGGLSLGGTRPSKGRQPSRRGIALAPLLP